MATKTDKTQTVQPFAVDFGYATFHLIGTSGLIYHAMAAKGIRELLHPKGRLTAADKAANLKHNPLQEYQDSVYMHRDPKAPTALMIPGGHFKQALELAALHVPGVKKTEVERLVHVMENEASVFGIPTMRMDIVRMADINRTPDVRTRAFLPDWCTTITVRYVQPNFSAQAIASLLGAAGMMSGVGDWRIGKGGQYGQWELVNEDDPRLEAIRGMGGRKAQEASLADPAFVNEDTAKLYDWWQEEVAKKDEATQAKLKGKAKADA